MVLTKQYLSQNVLEAARERIAWTFDNFERVCVSFSGGKDSSVMLHLVMDEAAKRSQKVHVLFIDWEAQFKLTIEHVTHCFDEYKDLIIPHWVCLPMITTNACSMYEPEWICWDPKKKPVWVREIPPLGISDYDAFPFYYENMTFEEFVPAFGDWLGEGTAMMVGIRTTESLNRWRTLFNHAKVSYQGKQWTTKVGKAFNVYPIYDWKSEDIWTYFSTSQKPYNKLYDYMLQAGLSVHQMRICEPFGDEQRQGLWLFHIVEPETWNKLLGRVNGVNTASIYTGEKGFLGDVRISKPDDLTWKQFAFHLLRSMPTPTAEHYKNKITVWLQWYRKHGAPKYDLASGLDDVFDELPGDTGSDDKPSWRRVCKMLLKNDYWAKTLCFSPTKQGSYEDYIKMMHKRRKNWGIFDEGV